MRSLYPNQPQMGQNFYHGMLMPLHDSMPSFMNFRRVSDLIEFKNQVSQCLRSGVGGRVFDIHSVSCMGPNHATKDTNLIFLTNLYEVEHVHVVRIFIMHIKCLENPVNV